MTRSECTNGKSHNGYSLIRVSLLACTASLILHGIYMLLLGLKFALGGFLFLVPNPDQLWPLRHP